MSTAAECDATSAAAETGAGKFRNPLAFVSIAVRGSRAPPSGLRQISTSQRRQRRRLAASAHRDARPQPAACKQQDSQSQKNTRQRTVERADRQRWVIRV
jgi:hypothetical protein